VEYGEVRVKARRRTAALQEIRDALEDRTIELAEFALHRESTRRGVSRPHQVTRRRDIIR